jgi:hypothetical protein
MTTHTHQLLIDRGVQDTRGLVILILFSIGTIERSNIDIDSSSNVYAAQTCDGACYFQLNIRSGS